MSKKEAKKAKPAKAAETSAAFNINAKEFRDLLEKEFKLDADSAAQLKQARQYVFDNPAIFMPATHPSQLAHIPAHMRDSFETPLEITRPRLRLYYDTVDLDGLANNIEIRQEQRKHGYKQVIKIGGNATAADPLLDRLEVPCKIGKYGVDFDAIEQDSIRKHLKSIFGGKPIKPLVCMISQRTRFEYHPEGQKDVVIELGFDTPCHGISFTGYSWVTHQLELEKVEGPDDHAEVRRLLEREERRFARFGMTRSVISKPYLGFTQMQDSLQTPEGRALFDRHDSTKPWWLNDRKGGKTPVANLAALV